MENKETLIEKIKNLLKKAESVKAMGNLAEAEAFSMKAQELMLKHSVEAEEIRRSTGAKMQMKLTVWNWDELTNRHESDWVKNLILSLCAGNMLRVITLSPNGHYTASNPDYKWKEADLAILGQPENIELTRYMLDQLISRARPMSKEAFKTYLGSEKRNTFIRGFLRGFAEGVGIKLAESLDKYKNESETGLMIINNNQALSTFVRSKFPSLGTGSSGHSLKGQGGIATGREAGKNTSVHRGISNSGKAHSIKQLS